MERSSRFALHISYDGTDFVGWQRQREGRSVQGELEHVFGRLARDTRVVVIGAGRTDAGVHANGQVAHVNMPGIYDIDDLHRRVCRMLPHDLNVSSIELVPSAFHARFRAVSRTYRYTVLRHRDPFRSRYAWLVERPLDADRLEPAAQRLVGRHDFTGLSKLNADTQDPVCLVTSARWLISNETYDFEITAERFLYGMVRLCVGLMVDIAIGRRQSEDVDRLIEAKNRSLQSPLAPARGLSLVQVQYPGDFFGQR